MEQYKVRSGQNIYDVAITLYGSVEGLFDLLASNKWLTMDTRLHYGMVLNYHKELTVNQGIVSWLKDHDVLVKNGEHVREYIDIEKFMEEHFRAHHPKLDEYLGSMSTDEKNMFWESQCIPRMIVKQTGKLSGLKFKLKKDKHVFIDWGDMTGIEEFGSVHSQSSHDVEHCFKGGGQHTIIFYGDFEFLELDLTDLNGTYYPLGTIYADKFITPIKDEKINKLIITI